MQNNEEKKDERKLKKGRNEKLTKRNNNTVNTANTMQRFPGRKKNFKIPIKMFQNLKKLMMKISQNKNKEQKRESFERFNQRKQEQRLTSIL